MTGSTGLAAPLVSQPPVSQPSLFGWGEPSLGSLGSLVRIDLGEGAWVDHLDGWLTGHQVLFDQLLADVAWEAQSRPMYDRIVKVPRLIGRLPDRGSAGELIGEASRALSLHYGVCFDRIALALYRDGSDSVAWHGDRVARQLTTAHVATVSVGEPRVFALRPRRGGATLRMGLGHGDLVVMGGTCQRTWEHCVPKARRAGPRIVIMFRPSATSDR